MPSPPDRERRRAEAEVIIDRILHGTPGGRVDPAVAESLRLLLVKYPGEPDRALMEHTREALAAAGMPMNAVFPEDLAPVEGKPGRNEPCSCGSGVKYKRCHGAPGWQES